MRRFEDAPDCLVPRLGDILGLGGLLCLLELAIVRCVDKIILVCWVVHHVGGLGKDLSGSAALTMDSRHELPTILRGLGSRG